MLEVIDLRCEYKSNPVGIDVKRPRMSWKLKSDQRAVLQSAYELDVAEDQSFENKVW